MVSLLSSSLIKADNTNKIDIEQVTPGDDLTIDIIQSGYDNKIFFSLGDVDGADLWIRQSGHNQEIGWVEWWGSGASWGGDIDYDDTELKLAQNCTKSAGNCNKNDIGFHFSPDNKDYKDADSKIFLDKALNYLNEVDGEIINLDTNIICDIPKIEPFRKDIKKNLSKLLGIDKNKINIKASSTENQGFVNSQNGVAAQTIISLQIPQREK